MRSMLEKIDYRDGLPVEVRIISIEEYPWRCHNCLTIAFVLEGEVGLKLSYSHYELSKGDVQIIHVGDVYGFNKLSDNNKILLMHIDTEAFRDDYPNLENEIFPTRITAAPSKYNEQKMLKEELLSTAVTYAEEGYATAEKIMRNAKHVLQILHDHFRNFVLIHKNREFEYKKFHDDVQAERIQHIVSYIYRNYDSKLSLARIASDVNLDKYYLSHLFQKYVGENFRLFVSMVRVEMAELKLLETNLSVTQISADVGFSDTKYFNENFELWFGYLPREYREHFRDSTVIGKKTDIIKYDRSSYKDIIEGYPGSPEEHADSRLDEISEIAGDLADLGDILEIEIIPQTGNCTYKLKLNTENVSAIRIIKENKNGD